jgi:hypothetical protein
MYRFGEHPPCSACPRSIEDDYFYRKVVFAVDCGCHLPAPICHRCRSIPSVDNKLLCSGCSKKGIRITIKKPNLEVRVPLLRFKKFRNDPSSQRNPVFRKILRNWNKFSEVAALHTRNTILHSMSYFKKWLSHQTFETRPVPHTFSTKNIWMMKRVTISKILVGHLTVSLQDKHRKKILVMILRRLLANIGYINELSLMINSDDSSSIACKHWIYQ